MKICFSGDLFLGVVQDDSMPRGEDLKGVALVLTSAWIGLLLRIYVLSRWAYKPIEIISTFVACNVWRPQLHALHVEQNGRVVFFKKFAKKMRRKKL